MRETHDIPIDLGLLLHHDDPAIREIGRVLDDVTQRVSVGLLPDGSTNRNVKADVAVEREDGEQIPLGTMANGFTLGLVDNDTGDWESFGSSGVLRAGRIYNGTAVTADGLWYVAISDLPSSSDGRFYIHAIVDGIVATTPTATLTSAKFDAPLLGSIVVHPVGDYCAIIATDSGDSNQSKLQIIDMTDKTSPSIIGELDLADDPPTLAEAVWDDVRQVIFWPGPGGGGGLDLFAYGVSTLTAPTLASTYTTSSLTSIQSCVLSVDRGFLYMSGNGGFESASLASNGTLTRDTTVAIAATYSSLAHNGTTIAGALRTTSSNINVVTIDISSTDQGAISVNTINAVSGSYANAGTFRNIRYVGNYLAGPSGIGAIGALFIVFDLTNLASVTEQLSTPLATVDVNSSVAMGGPETRSYIQLGADADVETWGIKQVIGGIAAFTAEQFVSKVVDKPPMVVASNLLVENSNADFLDSRHGSHYLNSGNFTGTGWTDLTDGGDTALHVHDIYSLADGTRPFTGVVGGIDPTVSNHLATKEYVDQSVSFVEEYYFGDDVSDIGGIYNDMLDLSSGDSESTFTTSDLNTGDDQPLENWATIAGVPGVTTFKHGIYEGHVHVEKTAGTKPVKVYFALYTRTSGGSETLRATSELSGYITSKVEVSIHAVLASDVSINTTDRIIIKWFANVEATGNNATIVLYAEGTNNSHLSIPTETEILSTVFVRQDGTKAFTGVVIGVAPTLDLHLSTKKYVDDNIGAGDFLADGSVPMTDVLDYGGNLIDNAPFLRGYIDGFITENDTDTEHDIKTNTGVCTDSLANNDRVIELTSAIVKRADAAWAEGTGNGGMATGTVAADTEYNLIIIEKDSDGTVDMMFDVSATGANVPVGYTARRRIGSVFTEGSANIRAYTQFLNTFRFATVVTDVADVGGTPGAYGTGTITVPPSVVALFEVAFGLTTVVEARFRWRPVGSSSNLDRFTIRSTGNSESKMRLQIQAFHEVDGSSQLEYTLAGGTWDFATIKTVGWEDSRGSNV